MTSPDRMAQARRINEEIAELQRRKQEVLEGRAGTATVAQLREQLHEVLTMTRSLPADFRQLRSMVEDRHKVIAREALGGLGTRFLAHTSGEAPSPATYSPAFQQTLWLPAAAFAAALAATFLLPKRAARPEGVA
jgi:hypothetical protein